MFRPGQQAFSSRSSRASLSATLRHMGAGGEGVCVQKLQLLAFKQSVFFSELPPLPQSDTLRFTFPPA